MAFWKWSRTASSNATADNTINWAEGMAPSAVNDSARAMMARLAEWRDDVSGTITTAGSSTAYTLASNQGFDNFPDLGGAMIAFVPHTTNAGGGGTQVTLNVDGLGGKPIRTAPSVDIQSGVLIQGTPYLATYNNLDGAFYLQGMPNPYAIPVGGLLPYIGSSAPNTAFALPFGQAISRTTYAPLFALVGTTFGVGDGSTTFNIPDLRGRAIFGLDNMGGSAAGRITVAGGNFDGTVIGGTGGAQNNTIAAGNLPQLSFTGTPQTWNLNSNAPIGNAVANGTAGGTGVLAGSIGLNSVTVTPAGTVNTGGANTPMTNLPPALILPFIMRIV